jgi:ribonuclease Z
VNKNKVPVEFFEKLQWGEDYISNDITIPNAVLTFTNRPSGSYAYSADTKFDEALAEKVKHVDLLFHEATYLEDKLDKAISRYHSTAGQAAMLAKLAEVKRLIIGHFSSSYENLGEFLREAKAVFPHVELALEGETFIIS